MRMKKVILNGNEVLLRSNMLLDICGKQLRVIS